MSSLFVLHAEYERCVPLVRALRLRYKQDLDLTDVEAQMRTQVHTSPPLSLASTGGHGWADAVCSLGLR